jgi:hypothetical protein
MSNSTIFSTICIIVVESNTPIIFTCDNEHIDLIINNNDMTLTHVNVSDLKLIVELSFDNEMLTNNYITNDILGNLMVKYLINNTILNMCASLLTDKIDDIIIKQIKQLILNINQSNITLLNQKITNGRTKMMQYYNTDITPPPIMNRYSSVPY